VCFTEHRFYLFGLLQRILGFFKGDQQQCHRTQMFFRLNFEYFNQVTHESLIFVQTGHPLKCLYFIPFHRRFQTLAQFMEILHGKFNLFGAADVLLAGLADALHRHGNLIHTDHLLLAGY